MTCFVFVLFAFFARAYFARADVCRCRAYPGRGGGKRKKRMSCARTEFVCEQFDYRIMFVCAQEGILATSDSSTYVKESQK